MLLLAFSFLRKTVLGRMPYRVIEKFIKHTKRLHVICELTDIIMNYALKHIEIKYQLNKLILTIFFTYLLENL